tara:strand:+ start:2287 stop:2580 length:294 start_codon:yes stop_codon:yes gene_type:complete
MKSLYILTISLFSFLFTFHTAPIPAHAELFDSYEWEQRFDDLLDTIGLGNSEEEEVKDDTSIMEHPQVKASGYLLMVVGFFVLVMFIVLLLFFITRK